MSEVDTLSKYAEVVIDKIIHSENRDPDAEVKLNSKFDDDLGIDSLARVDLIVAIEKHYDAIFDESDLTDIVVVGDLVKIVEKTLSS